MLFPDACEDLEGCEELKYIVDGNVADVNKNIEIRLKVSGAKANLFRTGRRHQKLSHLYVTFNGIPESSRLLLEL